MYSRREQDQGDAEGKLANTARQEVQPRHAGDWLPPPSLAGGQHPWIRYLQWPDCGLLSPPASFTILSSVPDGGSATEWSSGERDNKPLPPVSSHFNALPSLHQLQEDPPASAGRAGGGGQLLEDRGQSTSSAKLL